MYSCACFGLQNKNHWTVFLWRPCPPTFLVSYMSLVSASCHIPVNDLSLSVKLRSDPSVPTKSISPLVQQSRVTVKKYAVVVQCPSASRSASLSLFDFPRRSLCWTRTRSFQFKICITNSIKSATDISLSGFNANSTNLIIFRLHIGFNAWLLDIRTCFCFTGLISGSRNLRLYY
jgi:hypothetical protein